MIFVIEGFQVVVDIAIKTLHQRLEIRVLLLQVSVSHVQMKYNQGDLSIAIYYVYISVAHYF